MFDFLLCEKGIYLAAQDSLPGLVSDRPDTAVGEKAYKQRQYKYYAESQKELVA